MVLTALTKPCTLRPMNRSIPSKTTEMTSSTHCQTRWKPEATSLLVLAKETSAPTNMPIREMTSMMGLASMATLRAVCPVVAAATAGTNWLTKLDASPATFWNTPDSELDSLLRASMAKVWIWVRCSCVQAFQK